MIIGYVSLFLKNRINDMFCKRFWPLCQIHWLQNQGNKSPSLQLFYSSPYLWKIIQNQISKTKEFFILLFLTIENLSKLYNISPYHNLQAKINCNKIILPNKISNSNMKIHLKSSFQINLQALQFLIHIKSTHCISIFFKGKFLLTS